MEDRIMIVEDEPAVLSLLLETFKQAGLKVEGFSNGREAYDRLSLGGYKLLLTDVHVPGFNGIELISKAHRLFPGMEALAMSGFGTEATKEKLDRLGIYGFVEKPVDVASLTTLVKEALKSDRLVRLHYLKHEPVVSLNRCHVLIADDNPAFLRMMGDFLTSHNYRVKAVNNGSQAYEDLLINDYDIAVLDINMPVMDGVETVKAIRENDPDTYIILVSGEADSSEIADAMRSGANRFFPKPFDFNDLLAVLEKVNYKQLVLSKQTRSKTELITQLNQRSWGRKIFDFFRFRDYFKKAAFVSVIMLVCLLMGYIINTATRNEGKVEDDSNSMYLQRLDGLIDAVREDTRIDNKR